MSTQLKRAAAAVVLTVCLLLTLAAGSFLASGKSFHNAQIAHAAIPLGICGGGVGTPC